MRQVFVGCYKNSMTRRLPYSIFISISVLVNQNIFLSYKQATVT